MSIHILKLVKSSKIFSALSNAELNTLIKKSEKIYLHKNKYLFHQGDISTDLYLLVSGKLVVIIKKENKERRIINDIFPGETVGELSALSHEPRTAHVKATTNSILLKLHSDEFRRLIHKHPSIIHHTIELLVERSQGLLKLLKTEKPSEKYILVIPATTKVSMDIITDHIKKSIGENKNITLITEQDIADHKCSSSAKIKNYIDSFDKKDSIIYIVQSYNSLFAKTILTKIDMVYLIANENSKPSLHADAIKMIQNIHRPRMIRPDLVLLHKKSDHLPTKTSEWLKLYNFHLHHHIRIHDDNDWQRLMRFICGRPIGLVLGGGGLRCWMHLGVIKAFMDAGIPIDMIGGSSAGAIVAGYYALQNFSKEALHKLQELSDVTNQTVKFRNLTWPAVSLFNGKSYTKKLKQVYIHKKIEDCWINCFIVGCNISDNHEVIYRKGYLWKAIRASTAVPAIYPPVVIRGKLHLDGGILNNLPVDIMRRYLGNHSIIIASALTHHNKDPEVYHFPSILTFWQTALAKAKLAHRDYKFPPFIDTFLKSLLAGSSLKQFENGNDAEILINPDLSEFRLLNITKIQQKKLIRLGYKSALNIIKKWKPKNGKKII